MIEKRSRVALSLTLGQLYALATLAIFPAAWLSFDPRTWRSLASNGLVAFREGQRAPMLTHAGTAAASLARVLASLATIPEAAES